MGPVLRQCLEAATAAPSIHNTQPWRFRPRADGIDLFADPGRRLDVIDPCGRALLISLGAALLNLRIAVLAHGRVPRVRLMPDAKDPDHVAAVTFGPATPVSATVRMLAQAIPRRHTNRRPFSNLRIPSEVLTELIEVSTVEGGHLVVADPGARESVLSLVRLAETTERRRPSYWMELSAGRAGRRATTAYRPRRMGRGVRWRPYRFATSAWSGRRDGEGWRPSRTSRPSRCCTRRPTRQCSGYDPARRSSEPC